LAGPDHAHAPSPTEADRKQSVALLLASLALERIGMASKVHAEIEKCSAALSSFDDSRNIVPELLSLGERLHTVMQDMTLKEMLMQSIMETIRKIKC
jgi:hypothetical protein